MFLTWFILFHFKTFINTKKANQIIILEVPKTSFKPYSYFFKHSVLLLWNMFLTWFFYFILKYLQIQKKKLSSPFPQSDYNIRSTDDFIQTFFTSCQTFFTFIIEYVFNMVYSISF